MRSPQLDADRRASRALGLALATGDILERDQPDRGGLPSSGVGRVARAEVFHRTHSIAPPLKGESRSDPWEMDGFGNSVAVLTPTA